jgi:simple sugar transport system permease protein
VSDQQGGSGRFNEGVDDALRKAREAFALQPILVVVYAVVLAVVVGGILVALTGGNPFEAYSALLRGMYGTPDRVAASFSRSTPYIASALALAFAFRAGLFNIGAEGQLLIGGVLAAWVATFSFVADIPGFIAIPLVLLAGLIGGLVWGGVPGVLRAKTGAHEVISTIMLNNIAILLTRWLVNSQDPFVLRDPSTSVPRTEFVADSARLPELVDSTPRLHLGYLVAIGMCVAVWFVFRRMSFGFEVTMVGTNPTAALYSGISVNRIIIAAMAISGALAGLGAALEVSGTRFFFQPGLFAFIGFDGIAIALLARANPYGIIFTALLWGSMLSGAPLMQQEAQVSIDVVRVVQALVLLFIAADAIVRYLFRLRTEEAALATEIGSGGRI